MRRSPLFSTKNIVFLIVIAGLFLGCSNKSENVRAPANELYQKGMMALNDSIKADAEKYFKKITVEHPGTRLATLAYLKIGDLNLSQKENNGQTLAAYARSQGNLQAADIMERLSRKL